MARVFDEWFLALTGDEQQAHEHERAEASEAGREEWEAAHPQPVPAAPKPRRWSESDRYALVDEIPF